MVSKQTVKNLIMDIKKLTGLTQEGIAERAGYRPKSLTQQISREEGLESIYQQLLREFKTDLGDTISMYTVANYSTKLAKGNNEDTKKPDDVSIIRHYQEFVERLQAENDTLRNDNSELRNKVNELIDKLIQKT